MHVPCKASSQSIARMAILVSTTTPGLLDARASVPHLKLVEPEKRKVNARDAVVDDHLADLGRLAKVELSRLCSSPTSDSVTRKYRIASNGFRCVAIDQWGGGSVRMHLCA